MMSLVRLHTIWLVAIILATTCATGKKDWGSRIDARSNFFEPLFAFDDVETAAQQYNARSSPKVGEQQQPQAAAKGLVQVLRDRDSAFTDEKIRSLVQQSPDVQHDSLSNYLALRNSPQQQQVNADAKSTTRSFISRPKVVSRTPQVTASIINDASDEQQLDSASRLRPETPENHWPALDNYYAKLRQSARPPATDAERYLQQQQQQQPQQQPIIVVVHHQQPTQFQQQEIDESLTGGYRNQPTLSYPSPGSEGLILIPGANSSSSGAGQKTSVLSPFLLQPSHYQPNIAQQQIYPASINDYSVQLPGQQLQVVGNSPVLRAGGIGADSVLFPMQHSLGSTQQQRVDTGDSSQNQLIKQLQAHVAQYRGSYRPSSSSNENRNYIAEWRKNPELMYLELQLERARHQQETFGHLYDPRRFHDRYNEEFYCGPRNHVQLLASPSDQSKQQQLTAAQLSTLTGKLHGPSLINQLIDVPLQLGVGEYPSHVGLYNGSISDDNYLCAATWIHESYALTLATCVRHMDPRKIHFRLGEWRLNRNQASGSSKDKQEEKEREKKMMIEGQIDKVFVFHGFRNDSLDHNLALVRFARPVHYYEAPYVTPACQIGSRHSLRATSCWAPTRNVTLSEYFDASGEGETKERKVVQMDELPVKLVATDEAECQRQTKMEFFNFMHPNYICSGDFRRSEWRAKLNKSDSFGSGIYCNEGGILTLVSIVHPLSAGSSSAYGYMDLSYYKDHWIKSVISGQSHGYSYN